MRRLVYLVLAASLILALIFIQGNGCNKNIYMRSLFAKRFSPAYVKFDKSKPLDKTELKEFEQLCKSGVFDADRGFCPYSVSTVNNGELTSFGLSKTGWIRTEWHPFPKLIHFSYEPFGKVLYMSDDWEDDYRSGLIVSNMPHRLVRYTEWDDRYPIWMDWNVDYLKQCMANTSITVKIRAFTRPPYGVSVAYRYFVPYMHYTFGSSVNILSDEVVPWGKSQMVVDVIDATRRPDEIDITIGDKTIRTDEQKYMLPEFFVQLTNTLMLAVDTGNNGRK